MSDIAFIRKRKEEKNKECKFGVQMLEMRFFSADIEEYSIGDIEEWRRGIFISICISHFLSH